MIRVRNKTATDILRAQNKKTDFFSDGKPKFQSRHRSPLSSCHRNASILLPEFSLNLTVRTMLTTSSTTFASTSASPPPYPSTPPPPNQHQNSNNYNFKPIDRRHILASIAFSMSTPLLTFPILNDSLNPFSVPSADARGLFQMPPVRLTNR